MSRICKPLFVVIILLFVFVAKAETQRIQFRKLNVKSGLNSNVVYSLLQDSKGFIWLGTKEGVNRFDGYNMVSFSLPKYFTDKIAHQRITSLCEDVDGYIWMGTPNGVVQLDPDSGEMKHFLLPSDNEKGLYVNDLIITGNGDIWLGTRNGLYLFNHAKKQFTRYKHFPYTNKTIRYSKGERIVKDLCIAKDGKLWIGTSGNGLIILDIKHKKKQFFRCSARNHKGDLSSNFVEHIFQDHKGDMWIATQNGLNYFNSDSEEFTVYKNSEDNPESLADNSLSVVGEDRNNNLWVGTKKGLDLFHPKTEKFSHYQNHPMHSESISSNNILSMLAERSGSLWLGTMQGINFFAQNNLVFDLYQHIPGEKNSLIDNTLRTAIAGPKAKVWIGSIKDGINSFDTKTKSFSSYKMRKGNKLWEKHNAIRSSYVAKNGKIFFGTDAGVLLYKESSNQFKNFNAQGRLDFQKGVFDIMQDQEGNYWFSEIEKGLWKWNPHTNKVSLYNGAKAGLETTNLKVLFQTNTGDIWVGSHLKGLYRLKKGADKFIVYRNSDDMGGISNNRIYALFQDDENRLWIGTGNGLNLFNEETNSFTLYNEKNGLPGNVILSIQQDSLKRLWIGTNKGLSCFDIENKQFANFKQEDGLQGNIFEYKIACTDKNFLMYFGGNNGLNVFNPYELKFNTYCPKLCFTDFTSAGESFSLVNTNENEKNEATVQIKNTDRNIRLNLTAMSFVQAEKNRFRYRILPLDSTWILLPAGRHEIELPELKVGDFRLEVMASNNHLKWNPIPAILNVKVKLDWRQYSWLFYGLLSLVIVIGLYFYFRIANAKKIKELHLKNSTIREKKQTNYLSNTQKKDEWNEAIKELNELILKEELFKDKRLSKGQLAAHLAWSEVRLSTILREGVKLNFNDFINTFRVNEVKVRLKDPQSRDYTLLAIAEECGFNSKTSFYRIFKKIAGITPSEYLDQL